MGRSEQKGKEASESPNHHRTVKWVLVDEWNSIQMWTVNALLNSIQRRIRAAAVARKG